MVAVMHNASMKIIEKILLRLGEAVFQNENGMFIKLTSMFAVLLLKLEILLQQGLRFLII